MTEKLRDKIEILEQEIKTSFEQTNLVTNVKIKGELNDPKNPLHLEYKINQNGNPRKKQAEIRLFRAHLIRDLIHNFPQIKEIKNDCDEHKSYREYVILHSKILINDKTQLKYQVLQTIKREIGNYTMQRKHE